MTEAKWAARLKTEDELGLKRSTLQMVWADRLRLPYPARNKEPHQLITFAEEPPKYRCPASEHGSIHACEPNTSHVPSQMAV